MHSNFTNKTANASLTKTKNLISLALSLSLLLISKFAPALSSAPLPSRMRTRVHVSKPRTKVCVAVVYSVWRPARALKGFPSRRKDSPRACVRACVAVGVCVCLQIYFAAPVFFFAGWRWAGSGLELGPSG